MYKLQANRELRELMKKHEIKLWQVASEIGIHEKTLIGWLRLELDKERSERVNDALNKIIEGEK